MASVSRSAAAVVLYLGLAILAPADGGTLWFGPNDHLVRPWKPEERGPLDFMQLFDSSSPWSMAARSVTYFQTNSFLFVGLSDQDLTTIINNLRARGIRFAIEDGGIEYDPTCGKSIEGYISADYELTLFRKFQRLGGVVDAYIADGPFWAGSLSPDGCRWSPAESGRRTAEFAMKLRTVFPNILVGSVEPYLNSQADDPRLTRYGEFLSSFRSSLGAEFAFLHADMPAAISAGWYERLAMVRAIAQVRGARFGIIYNGNSGDGHLLESSDAEWLENAWQKMITYELSAGGSPDDAILESWVRYPTHVLPESDPTAHTNLILRYTRPRTFIVAPRTRIVARGGAGRRVEGRVVDSAGAPVANVPVQLTGTPSEGAGLQHEYAIAGTAPAYATTALLAVRVNAECDGCTADVHLNLYDTSYSEGIENRVPNHDFAGGISGWGASGTGAVAVQIAGSSANLAITATSQEEVLLNSSVFPVSPGANYTVRFTARVEPRSFAGGYFAVIFLGSGSESQRERIWFPFTISGGSALTDALGDFTFGTVSYGDTSMEWSATFAGNDQYWPSIERSSPSRATRHLSPR